MTIDETIEREGGREREEGREDEWKEMEKRPQHTGRLSIALQQNLQKGLASWAWCAFLDKEKDKFLTNLRTVSL